MATGDDPPEVSPEYRQAFEEIKAQHQKDLQVHLDLIKSSFDRVLNFLKIVIKAPESANDILRAMVVLNHAYLEDFLRTLGTTFLPVADMSALDNVPLAGSGTKDRAEKFFLGKLTQHRGKTVDDVIRISVLEDLERRSFNSVTEIISFLETIGVSPQNGDWNTDLKKMSQLGEETKYGGMAALDEMIRRRHNIVHRADKTKDGAGLEPVSFDSFEVWRRTTYIFMMAVALGSLRELYKPDVILKKLKDKDVNPTPT
jgi:hypothetical protein